MNQDHQDLLHGLFVAATVSIEAAHETAIAGQSAGRTADYYGDLARRLWEMAGQIVALSDSALVIADQAAGGQSKPPESSC